MTREFCAEVVLPLLDEWDEGPRAELVWRFRAGLSRLRRLGGWADDERRYLIDLLDAASDPLDREALERLRGWLQQRV